MYYDLGCIRISKYYVKMEEDIHISSLARLTAHTIIRPQTRKFCLCIAKGKKQLLNSKFHQVIPTKDGTNQQRAWPTDSQQLNKVSSLCSLLTILMNLRKGSTTGKLKKKECNFVNVNVLNQWQQQAFLEVSSFDLKIIVPINH